MAVSSSARLLMCDGCCNAGGVLLFVAQCERSLRHYKLAEVDLESIQCSGMKPGTKTLSCCFAALVHANMLLRHTCSCSVLLCNRFFFFSFFSHSLRAQAMNPGGRTGHLCLL